MKNGDRRQLSLQGTFELSKSKAQSRAPLYTLDTIIAEDPLFGWFAYGGQLKMTDGGFEVLPQDGLRQRLHFVGRSGRFHILLERDGFAKGQPIVLDYGHPNLAKRVYSPQRFAFDLENRSGDMHRTTLSLRGLRPGRYILGVEGQEAGRLESVGHAWIRARIETNSTDLVSVEVIAA